jgi:hypothetical protein
LNDRLTASGKITADDFSVDAGVMLGWFNSNEQDWPPSNFVGVYMDSLSDTGRFFTPMYGTATGSAGSAGAPFLLLPPDGQSRQWSIDYDPNGAGGLGTIKVGLNGQFRTITLAPGQKAQGATFNRFGLFNMQDNNGKHSVIYLDDIRYTTSLPLPGDVNLDDKVDIFDINLVSAHWSETGSTADVNGDGHVDIFDVNFISTRWTAGGSASAVPEPNTCCLLALGGLAVMASTATRRWMSRE